MTGFTNALKGIGGEYELSRLVGFFGGVVYVICANAFVAYEVIWLGKAFDVTAYCLSFSTGLAGIVGGTAGAIAWKDKGVASAKVIAQTGAVPTPAIDGARVPQGAPPPVDTPIEGDAADLPDYAK